MSSSTSSSTLPSGLAVLSTFPDVLFIPEIESAGEGMELSLCTTRKPMANSQGWLRRSHLLPHQQLAPGTAVVQPVKDDPKSWSSNANSLSHGAGSLWLISPTQGAKPLLSLFSPFTVMLACGLCGAGAMLPVQIFGGLVWILVASSKVPEPMLQGWVMFVSVFCFVMSISLLCLYICGAHGGGGCWVTLDVLCHGTAALFYLSAAVLEAYMTYTLRFSSPGQEYRENIAAVVFAFVATLLYVIHQVFSLLRWKSS